MSIVKMKRLRVIGLEEERDDLLQQLLHVGCVEVTQPDDKLSDPQWTALLRRENSVLSDVKSQVSAVNAALEALRKYAPTKFSLFVQHHDMQESTFLDDGKLRQALESAGEINQRTQRIAQIMAQVNRLGTQRVTLEPWEGLDLPLDTRSTEHAKITLGACPAAVSLEELRGALSAAAATAEVIEAATDKELHYLLFCCHKQDEEAAGEVLKRYGFSATSFKEFSGTAAENIRRIDGELEQLEREKEQLTQELAGFGESRAALQVCSDRLAQEQSKAEAREKLLTNGTIVFFEGWVTEPGLPELERVLGKFACAWETAEPLDEEEPPVLLQNPKYMQPINMVTEMYSMPAYRGIDPNPLIFWFYIFFFGFMFADVAYGIIIWLVSFLITKKFRPKYTMGYMFKLGQYLGISTLICGIFTGGFFGDVIPKFAENMLGITSDQLPVWFQTFSNGIIVNPIGDPMTVLVIAIGIGIVHLIFGQCIHIYMGFRDGRGIDSLLDVVPWWVVFIGIASLALGGPAWVIILGVLLLIATQGRAKPGIIRKIMGGIGSLYDVTSWLSDILSYSRLMALMLATSVIASVMNTLGTLGGLTAVGMVLFVLVFLIGHTFNIGVNLIGTYVHAARLQYLEFYGKFYIEGGTPFQPLTYKTKYVDIIKEEK